MRNIYRYTRLYRLISITTTSDRVSIGEAARLDIGLREREEFWSEWYTCRKSSIIILRILYGNAVNNQYFLATQGNQVSCVNILLLSCGI